MSGMENENENGS